MTPLATPVHHGTVSSVRVEEASDPLFRGFPPAFRAVRYNSLTVSSDPLPDQLVPLAHAQDDRTLMAVRHATLPFWGVQFHPESVCTEHGSLLLSNFRVTLSWPRVRREE